MTASQPSKRRRPLLIGLAALLGAGLVVTLAMQHQQRRLEQQRQQQTLLPRRIAAIGRVEPLDRVVKVSVPAAS
jgi:hypothetical protein